MVHLLQTGGVGCFAYVWYELGKWTIRLLLFIRSERTLMLSIVLPIDGRAWTAFAHSVPRGGAETETKP